MIIPPFIETANDQAWKEDDLSVITQWDEEEEEDDDEEEDARRADENDDHEPDLESAAALVDRWEESFSSLNHSFSCNKSEATTTTTKLNTTPICSSTSGRGSRRIPLQHQHQQRLPPRNFSYDTAGGKLSNSGRGLRSLPRAGGMMNNLSYRKLSLSRRDLLMSSATATATSSSLCNTGNGSQHTVPTTTSTGDDSTYRSCCSSRRTGCCSSIMTPPTQPRRNISNSSLSSGSRSTRV